MASKYRAAYAALGEERAQKVEAMSTKIDRNTTAGQMEISEADQFWILRRDRQWCEIPGGFK